MDKVEKAMVIVGFIGCIGFAANTINFHLTLIKIDSEHQKKEQEYYSKWRQKQ